MRQRLFILVGLFILIAVLIGLNAASYTQKEKLPDSEMLPNRSTFNGGATGSRAFFDLLNETGRKPVRWIEPPAELDNRSSPSTFVVIGSLRQEYSDKEIEDLLRWVSQGRRLVIIDRNPPVSLAKTTANYEITLEGFEKPFFDTDAYNQPEMTLGTKAAKPSQPTVYTRGVNAIQPSRFATSIEVRRIDNPEVQEMMYGRGNAPVDFDPTPPTDDEEDFSGMPTPKPLKTVKDKLGAPAATTPDRSNPQNEDYSVQTEDSTTTVALTAPVVHFANDRKNIVVDVPFGSGRIVFLSDPYIVSNAGISIADNAALAVNLVGSDGTIAFDEYHQGYGSNRNRFFEFFDGTPVIAMFLQIALLIGLVFFSQSRRFARPVPEPEPNRLSKLEYVSAMAELQQRTNGYDIAVENIYTDFRRRVARLVGVDNFTASRRNLALLIVERLPDENADEVESVMKRCEDVMHGDRTGKKEVLRLTKRLREIEENLGLQRRKKNAGER
ncbi:MAG: DUF4350 domain-containing protein [Acidobacteria bacterium]|nr:DUF4350 domain-containing protein [Acidobacteriota bacterium]